MNLVLFTAGELATPLPAHDSRAQHILKVLRRSPGETFVAGLVDGAHGVATLLGIGNEGLRLAFTPTHDAPPLSPIWLLIGLPRPQTARDLLRDATTLGVARIDFVATARADPNYATSSLWTSDEWQRHLLVGASQACDTRIPKVTWNLTLPAALTATARETVSAPAAAAASPTRPLRRFALDNYEATHSLAAALARDTENNPQNGRTALPEPICLAFGPERGWAETDRTALRTAGFTLCSLGSRVLRLETAVVAALALVHFAKV